MTAGMVAYLERQARLDRVDSMLSLLRVQHAADPERMLRDLEQQRRDLEPKEAQAIRDDPKTVRQKLAALGLRKGS